MSEFNLNEIEFEKVETGTSEKIGEGQSGENINELFSHIENEKKNVSKPSEKKYLEGEFAARVLFRVLNGAFNLAVLWKTNRTASDLNIKVDDDDKEDFLNIVGAGIGSGTIKMPHPLIMFFVLVLSIYLEPVGALIFYDDKKEFSKINLGTKTKMGFKAIEKKKKGGGTGSGRHKSSCATNRGEQCDCR